MESWASKLAWAKRARLLHAVAYEPQEDLKVIQLAFSIFRISVSGPR